MQYLQWQHFRQRWNIESSAARASPVAKLTSFNDIVCIEHECYDPEDIADRVSCTLSSRSIRLDVGLTAELVAELVDNFVHAIQRQRRQRAWFSAIPGLSGVDLALGDCGIGILQSLSKNSRYRYIEKKSHMDAASLAFQEKVGSGVEGGMGLSTVRENVVQMKGSMFLSTGDGWVFVGRGLEEVGDQAYDLPGVQIEVSIPL